ncbi:MAG TPA: sigma-70 family RNA polymerase sigma factor [Thermoanaerobaculia bacterium]|nr:sigma-70 family RNA polymerase sigma factor [Thermoanaerobaculia bacterium]
MSAIDVTLGYQRVRPVRSDEQVADLVALVGSARRGDRTSFGRLYELFAPIVHGILLARAPSSIVDDLCQEVFLVALHRIETLRDEASFGGWIAEISRNQANDHFRAMRRKGISVETNEEDEALAIEGDQVELAEAKALLAVIRGLPEAYRETLILRFVEGLTGPEIAARTGLTHGSVRVNLNRGMKRLRDALQRKP